MEIDVKFLLEFNGVKTLHDTPVGTSMAIINMYPDVDILNKELMRHVIDNIMDEKEGYSFPIQVVDDNPIRITKMRVRQ